MTTVVAPLSTRSPRGHRTGAEKPFADPEGLRALLQRLHTSGPGAWRYDPEASELMQFVAARYEALARKFGMEPTDAAVAAFEAMLNPSTRNAQDPWAVVTVAVRITLIAENRAGGLLCSPERARRPEYSVFHDAERFSDREVDPIEYHPAFQETESEPDAGFWVAEEAARLLILLEWAPDTARAAVEHVCARLADIGDRHTAYESLRRDKVLRAQLDLGRNAWLGLLRILLGQSTTTGRLRQGILARLLVGDSIPDLLADDRIVSAVATANPLGPEEPR